MSRARRHTIAAVAIAFVAAGQLLAAPVAQADTTTTTGTVVVHGPIRCC